MRVLMVGAGNCQRHMIERLKQRGYYVAAADYNTMTAAKRLADAAVTADAFDPDSIERAARAHRVDAVLTAGTDQPVRTVAEVCARLGLACDLTPETARLVTDKRAMKERFEAAGIPAARSRAVGAFARPADLRGLRAPYVVKPVDSQGQRGITLARTADEAIAAVPRALSYSRADSALVEEYYESGEITVTGWVSSGIPHILTVTDRVCFPPEQHLGVCVSHEYPSMRLRAPDGRRFAEEVSRLTEHVCRAFGIAEGPIYFQMLAGSDGLRVNEVACRIGGAFEDFTVPMVTGFSLLDAVIDRSLGIPAAPPALPPLADRCRPAVYYSTQLFFCRPPGDGRPLREGEESGSRAVARTSLPSSAVRSELYLAPGGMVAPIESAAQRAGYFIVRGSSQAEVERELAAAFRELHVENGRGENLVIVPDRLALLALAD